jgi:hypothetical protein
MPLLLLWIMKHMLWLLLLVLWLPLQLLDGFWSCSCSCGQFRARQCRTQQAI